MKNILTFFYGYLALISLIFSAVTTYPQTADSLQSKKIILKTSLSEFAHSIILNTVNFNIGLEKHFKERNTIYGNFGIIHSFEPPKGWLALSSLSTKGFKIQIEKRHYLNKHKIFEPAILIFWPHIFQYHSQKLQNSGYYYAIYSACQFTTTNREESILDYSADNSGTTTNYYKKNIYTVDRNVYRLGFKFGYQCIKSHGLSIDYAIGVGGQYISSNVNNRFEINNDKDLPWNRNFDDGKGLYPCIVCQLCLGWSFK